LLAFKLPESLALEAALAPEAMMVKFGFALECLVLDGYASRQLGSWRDEVWTLV